MRQERLSTGGQFHTANGAVEKLRPEPDFHVLYRTAKRRLRKRKRFCGPT